MNDEHPCESMTHIALETARGLRLAACEVKVEQRKTRAVTWERQSGGQPTPMEPRNRTVMHVRVFQSSGKCGFASGATNTAASVHKLVNLAAERSRDPDAAVASGPAERFAPRDKGLGLFDRRNPQLTDEARVAAVDENVEGARSVSGAEPQSFHYSEELIHRRVVNSIGVDQYERSTNYRLTGRVQFGEHTVEQAVHSRHFADVASLPLGADIANQVARYTDVHQHPAGPTLVVIEPRVIAKIMTAAIPAFDRRLVDAGKSFLHVGQRIGSEKLHMVDDALQFGGVQTRSFDDRGVPALDLPLIREGQVGALYMSVEDAHDQDARPSGHEHSEKLWPGNLLLRSGTRSRNMIFPELGEFVILDELSAPSGSWYNLRKGTLNLTGQYFASNAGSAPTYIGVRTIRTTFQDLWRGIQEVGNDQQRHGFVDVSTWVVDGLTLD